jgi:hypothetical protein
MPRTPEPADWPDISAKEEDCSEPMRVDQLDYDDPEREWL